MKIMSLSVAALLAATPALSQSLPISHEGTSVTFAYDDYDDDGDVGSTYVLNATSRYSLGGNFGVQFSLGYNEEEEDRDYYGSRAFLDINPYYAIGDGEIGVFYTFVKGYGNSGDGTQFGVSGNQRYGDFYFEGYASVYEEDGNNYNPVGLAFAYDITSDINVYVAQRRDVEDDGDYFARSSVGASYDLSGLSSSAVPVTLGIEYSIFHEEGESIGDSDWNQISFVATYEFGGDAKPSIFRGVRSTDFYFD